MNDSTSQEPEIVKMSDYMQDKPVVQTPVTNTTTTTTTTVVPTVNTNMRVGSDSVIPSKKSNLKFILASIILLLIVVGAAAGLYLNQFSQDLRQQAYTVDSSCPDFEAWGNCDPNGEEPENSCTGSVVELPECTQGYKVWICGNKNWMPKYGDPGNEECSSQCPWELTNGVCCPTGVDARTPGTGNYKCVADPFVARCESWNNSACPANQQGYWHAIDWCTGAGCECGPNGLFSHYSGPGCECGGNNEIACNDICTSDEQCSSVNSGWTCDDESNRCRLASNPGDTSCQPVDDTTYSCNSDCTTNEQCSGDLGANYSCVTNKCRLTSNPSSTSCQPVGDTTYSCNSDCTTNEQCSSDLGSNYSCVTNKCRLTSNPNSTTCEPAVVYACNSDCTTNEQCSGDLGANYSCVTNKCRLTSNPSSTTCQPGVALICNDICTADSQCPTNTQCMKTYDWSGNFTEVTVDYNSVGDGIITGLSAYMNANGVVEQYLVRNNRIYHRPNRTASWSDVTANVDGVGDNGDPIYSYNAYVMSNGVVGAYLNKGNDIWYHTSENWNNWQKVTSNVSGIGSGTITGYSAQRYSDEHSGITLGYLIKGNKIWNTTSSNWNSWQDVTANVASYGVGNFTDMNFFIDADGSINHYVVRGGDIFYKKSPFTANKQCRLPAYPDSGSCQPPVASLQCNGDCTTSAECAAVNSAWSCISNKCRLTTNPSSTNCEAVTQGPMCKDVAILDKDNNELDPKAIPSSFYISQIIKLRCAPDNVENPLIQKYQFRITEPDGQVVEGSTLNPTGNTRVSLPYTIQESGKFKAQCRICLTDDTCQAYTDILTL